MRKLILAACVALVFVSYAAAQNCPGGVCPIPPQQQYRPQGFVGGFVDEFPPQAMTYEFQSMTYSRMPTVRYEVRWVQPPPIIRYERPTRTRIRVRIR